MLLELGTDANTVDKNGDTAMHGAAYNISPLVVKLLGERGADPQIWRDAAVHRRKVTPAVSRVPMRRPWKRITKLMVAAGISTEASGRRSPIVTRSRCADSRTAKVRRPGSCTV
jgi:ankyrin repeat protein